jgi:hypothetical protein
VNARNSNNTLISKYLGWESNTRLRMGMEKELSLDLRSMVETRAGKPAESILAGK